jgi:uncharacterized membrane protein YjjP (DUF1212 family)
MLRFAGWATLGLGAAAFGIGALLGFDELAKIWLAIGGLLLAASVTSFLGARPTRYGLVSALVACALLLLLPPLGTILTVVIAIVASQTWPQLRDYYRLRRAT